MARPRKLIAILQSNYIPWKGYFDIIAAVDEFVLFDDVQFTRRDWRNRNKIVLDGKVHWLTVPVRTRGAFDATVGSINVSDPGWARKHWATIRHAYGKAPHFRRFGPQLEETYARLADVERLSDINAELLELLAGWLSIATPFVRSDSVPRIADTPTGRLVEICQARGADAYLSGPMARAYIRPEEFTAVGIGLYFADYSGYPVYEQRMTPFEHGVSAVDLLMRCGPEARDHLKSPREHASFCRPERSGIGTP